MKNIRKFAVCALFFPAVPASAVPAPAVTLEAGNAAVASGMTGKLSETAAGLSAAQEAGDSARAEALLARLFNGGDITESAAPVYAARAVEAPAARAVPAARSAAEELEAAAGPDAAAAVAAAPEGGAAAGAKAEDPAAGEDADSAKEKAAKLKDFKTGFYITILALLLLLLL